MLLIIQQLSSRKLNSSSSNLTMGVESEDNSQEWRTDAIYFDYA